MIASGEGATRFHYFQYYPKKTSLPRCLLYYQFRFVEQAKEADKSAIKTHHPHNIGHATNKYILRRFSSSRGMSVDVGAGKSNKLAWLMEEGQIGHWKSSLVLFAPFPSSNDVPVLLLNQLILGTADNKIFSPMVPSAHLRRAQLPNNSRVLFWVEETQPSP